MLYFRFDDIDIPRLGFGTWPLKGETCETAVRTALETGYRHIDTAVMYENEREVGKAIAGSGIDRSEIFLTTKIWMEDIEAGRVADATDRALERLGTGQVDLLLLHWPVTGMPIREQVHQLAEVKSAGKARLIGVSNYTAAQLHEALEVMPGLAAVQCEYHPSLDQDPVLNVVRDAGMLFTSYSPLGKAANFDHPVIRKLAERHGKEPAQIVLRWHLQQPNVSAVPKATSRAHIEANFDVFDFELTPEEMKSLFGLVRPDGRIINPGWAPQWDTGVA